MSQLHNFATVSCANNITIYDLMALSFLSSRSSKREAIEANFMLGTPRSWFKLRLGGQECLG